jgi:hypothetical protein
MMEVGFGKWLANSTLIEAYILERVQQKGKQKNRPNLVRTVFFPVGILTDHIPNKVGRLKAEFTRSVNFFD